LRLTSTSSSVQVKGVVEPVGVFELEGVGTFRTRLDRSRSRGLSAFVGRDRDMTLLEAALEPNAASPTIAAVPQIGVPTEKPSARLAAGGHRCAADRENTGPGLINPRRQASDDAGQIGADISHIVALSSAAPANLATPLLTVLCQQLSG
jgi:hypothetical protein